MKVAVIGSRCLEVDISSYIPIEAVEIISGGAEGIDAIAERYADEHKLSKHIIRPRYDLHKRGAPIVRNKRIVVEADLVLAFWDGVSKGTKSVIDYAEKVGKPVQVIQIQREQ